MFDDQRRCAARRRDCRPHSWGFLMRARFQLTALALAAPLAACGGSAAPSAAATRPASATAATCATPRSGTNAALTVALAAADLPSAASAFKQTGDGLLGSTPGTDARVFASADGQTRAEVDLAADTDKAAAATDYVAYMTAAAKQVARESTSTTPRIGTRANEFAGSDSMSRSIVSLSFVQCSVIGVVTMVSSNTTVDPAVVEAVARSQVAKISTTGV
jgi:hypothetical protein